MSDYGPKMIVMLREHEVAIRYLFRLMLDYFWLFPIASIAIYGLFVSRHMGMDRAAVLFSISLPGSTLFPVVLSLEPSSCCGIMDVFSLLLPAMWILPLVSLWQAVNLVRNNHKRIERASIIIAIGLVALYPITSFSFWYFNSIKSP